MNKIENPSGLIEHADGTLEHIDETVEYTGDLPTKTFNNFKEKKGNKNSVEIFSTDTIIVKAKEAKKTKKVVLKTKEKKLDMKDFFDKNHLSLIEHAVKTNEPVMIIGETGTGKTTLVQEVASNNGKELSRVSMNRDTGAEELIGKFTLKSEIVDELDTKGKPTGKQMSLQSTEWQDGVLTDAVRNGKWIVLDEINAASAEVLFILHQLLDGGKQLVLVEKGNEVVKQHKDFRFFATRNPDTYSGTQIMNMAFQSRFLLLEVKHLQQDIEIDFLEKKYGETTKAGKKEFIEITSIAKKLRTYHENDTITYFCSTRDLEQVRNLVDSGMDTEQAFIYSVFNKIPKDELEEISESSGDKNIINIIKKMSNEGIKEYKTEQEGRKALEDIIDEIIENKVQLKDIEDKLKECRTEVTKASKAMSDRWNELDLENTKMKEERHNFDKLVKAEVVKTLRKLIPDSKV